MTTVGYECDARLVEHSMCRSERVEMKREKATRSNAATSAWKKIQRYYEDGDFPATPSTNACRFCAYKEICRSNGVPVPYR